MPPAPEFVNPRLEELRVLLGLSTRMFSSLIRHPHSALADQKPPFVAFLEYDLDVELNTDEDFDDLGIVQLDEPGVKDSMNDYYELCNEVNPPHDPINLNGIEKGWKAMAAAAKELHEFFGTSADIVLHALVNHVIEPERNNALVRRLWARAPPSDEVLADAGVICRWKFARSLGYLNTHRHRSRPRFTYEVAFQTPQRLGISLDIDNIKAACSCIMLHEYFSVPFAVRLLEQGKGVIAYNPYSAAQPFRVDSRNQDAELTDEAFEAVRPPEMSIADAQHEIGLATYTWSRYAAEEMPRGATMILDILSWLQTHHQRGFGPLIVTWELVRRFLERGGSDFYVGGLRATDDEKDKLIALGKRKEASPQEIYELVPRIPLTRAWELVHGHSMSHTKGKGRRRKVKHTAQSGDEASENDGDDVGAGAVANVAAGDDGEEGAGQGAT